jgi:hypothetical protein
MALTAASFKIAFEAFATTDDPEINRAITRSLLYLSVDRFGAFYDEAQGNLVAHFIAISNKDKAMGIQGRAGDVVSKSAMTPAGQASVSRSSEAVMAEMKDPFLRTQYGQRYAWIRDIVGLGGVAAGADSC